MQSFTTTTRLRVLGIAALSGLRFWAGPALLSWTAAHGQLPALGQTAFGLIGSRRAAYGIALGLWSESVADKALPLPARTEPMALASRALAGALTGAILFATEDAPIYEGIAIGAGVAMIGGAVATLVRKWATTRLGVPDAVLGLIEDGLIVCGSALVRRSPGQPGIEA